jgi:hypothetical protein
MESISRRTFCRFLLGAQGLWPGRRFRGAKDVEPALQLMQGLQLDPLNAAARSQDIAMYGRVLDYRPEHLYRMAYERRRAFDYGGSLFMYPIQEFPYWRAIMPRVENYSRLVQLRRKFPDAMGRVLQALRENGPMSNRDFEGRGLGEWSYRGRKDTAVALYYSWLLGEVMIAGRRGFDRIYDLRERVLPKAYDYTAPLEQAEDFFARKAIAVQGIMRAKRFRIEWQGSIDRQVQAQEGERKLAELHERKTIASLHLQGFKEAWITLAENLPHLEALESDRVPRPWKPMRPTTLEEVTLLAPLEMVSARGRAKQVFDFDYVWEVYKPAHLRRWGYYTLPILYGDDLVARLDPKLDRRNGTLEILGFWLEDDAPRDEAFANAVAGGLIRFAQMIGANRVDVRGVKPARLRSHLKQKVKF